MSACYCPSFGGSPQICGGNSQPCGNSHKGFFNATSGVQLCCADGDECGANSICKFDTSATGHPSGGSGYYLGGCTDQTLTDPLCRSDCQDRFQLPAEDIVNTSASGVWSCCGVDSNGAVNCSLPVPAASFETSWTADDFPGPIDAVLSPAPTTSLSTSTSISTSSSSSTISSATSMTSTLMSTSSSSSASISTSSSSAQATSAPSSSSSSALSDGAKAGIGVGVTVGAIAILGLIAALIIRARRWSRQAGNRPAELEGGDTSEKKKILNAGVHASPPAVIYEADGTASRTNLDPAELESNAPRLNPK